MPKQLPFAKDFEYSLPEGYTMEPDIRTKLDTLVDKTGLSNAEAQEFIDLHVELTEAFIKGYIASIKDACEPKPLTDN